MSCNSSYAIFCDDIRHETSGKLSLIGVYGTHMFVEGWPTKLPKLCVHFSIKLSEDDVLNDKNLQVRLKRGSEVISEVSLEGGFSFPEGMGDADDVRLSGALEMPFLELSEPFRFVVQFLNGDTERSIGELIVSKGNGP